MGWVGNPRESRKYVLCPRAIPKKNPRYIHISNMENQHVVGPKTLVQHAEGADLPSSQQQEQQEVAPLLLLVGETTIRS